LAWGDTLDSGTENHGLRAHTKILIASAGQPGFASVWAAYFGAHRGTPASHACIYKIVPTVTGCNQGTLTALPTGGFGAIAIVDAYEDRPHPFLHAVRACGSEVSDCLCQRLAAGPRSNWGWELEDSLDIEWAHAVAPKTKIYLVEARRNTIAMARDNLALATDPSELPAFRWQTSPFKTTKLHFNPTC
jgi:hypothetical protein